ncbi:MAG: Rpn family recombination-promoting nuclease/putative transposase [Tumebacillaceae bacterium]
MLDILAKTRKNVHINIEIQLSNQSNIKKRTLYYWSRVYSRQINKGDSYSELAQTITINILNFRLLQETDRFHTTFHLYEDQESFLLTDVMEIHFIEIPKLMVKWEQGTVHPQQDALVRWLLLLEADDNVEIRRELEAIALEDPVIQRAFDVWEELSRDDKKWWEYESRRKAMIDKWSAEKEAELREQKALEKGLQEGLQEAKLEIALKLLARDMTIDEVAELSGLPIKQVEQLKAQQ